MPQLKLQNYNTYKFNYLYKRDYLIGLFLIAMPLAVYWQIYDFQMLWDDIGLYEKRNLHFDNPYIQQPTFANLQRLFSQPYFNMYIPISYMLWGWLKFFADYLHLPLNSVLHIANLILHTSNGLLVFVLLRQFIANRYAVFVGVLFFLLHPMQVESVVWISEFRGLLAAFFVLLAWYFYILSISSSKVLVKSQYIASLVFLFIALLSKPSAAVLPLFIFATNYYYGLSLQKNIFKTLPFAIVTFLAVINAYFIQSNFETNFTDHIIAIWQRPIAWLDSIVFYLWKILYPFNLSASYALPPKFISQQWWFYPLALAPLMLLTLLFFVRHKYRLLVFAATLFVVGFLPTSGLISFGFQKFSLVANRYLYFSFIGVSLFIGAILSTTGKKYLWGFFSIILLAATAISYYQQIPIWQNEFKLWQHSAKLEARPSYAKTNLQVAIYHNEPIFTRIYNKSIKFIEAGDDDKAWEVFGFLLKYYPQLKYQIWYDKLFYQKSMISYRQKQYQEAAMDLTQAIKLSPSNTVFLNARIAAFLQLKQYKNARKDIANLAKINGKVDAENQHHCLVNNCPEGKFFYNDESLFFALYEQGIELALAEYGNKALRFFDYLLSYHESNNYQNRYERLFYNRALILMQQEEFPDALADFAQVLAMNPYKMDAHIFRIRIYVSTGKCDEALDELLIINAKQMQLPPEFLHNLNSVCNVR